MRFLDDFVNGFLPNEVIDHTNVILDLEIFKNLRFTKIETHNYWSFYR
jgi:hypothetical protein